MRNLDLQFAAAAGPRVDGIDVAQLLRDLGEASAASSAVDLFSLCLSAQRVLASVHAAASSGLLVETSLAEAELLTFYRAMHDDGRSRLVSLAKRLQKPFARQRPGLKLVEGGQGRRGRGFATDGKTNMERTGDGK